MIKCVHQTSHKHSAVKQQQNLFIIHRLETCIDSMNQKSEPILTSHKLSYIRRLW